MAYDENLAGRVRDVLAGDLGLSERKMFGGLAFMLEGHMCCGIVGDELMLRLGVDGADTALAQPHVRPWTSPASRWPGWSTCRRTGCADRLASLGRPRERLRAHAAAEGRNRPMSFGRPQRPITALAVRTDSRRHVCIRRRHSECRR